MESNGLEFRLAKCRQQRFLDEAEQDRLFKRLIGAPLSALSRAMTAIAVYLSTVVFWQL